ncbi:hypothetical protein ACL9RL_12300 [Plantibacter sp. Mn2098]|uniref:hypothetical protein n=1 Tax=Plantibacter sp. Mn2098 TaxID=3395266 RepID=UPI003BD2FE5D
MTTREFDLTMTVAVRPETAIDYLMDLNRQRGLHPFLVSADIIESGTTDAQPWFLWRIHERPRLGRLTYSIRFTATMRRISPTTMVGNVAAAPGCTLVTRTDAQLIESEGRTRTVLHEITTVAAPRPVLGYMWRQAFAAHARVYERLPTEMSTL